MTQPTEHETETLLRDSLDRLAARAPDGHEVRNALARAAARRPRARLALVGAVAAVVLIAAGVAVGTRLLTSPEDVPAASPGRPVLAWSPGWLPDGFTEQYRESGPGPAPQVRRWSAGPARISLSAYSTSDPEWAQAPMRIAALPDQVVVRGRVGMVTGDVGTAAGLTWMPDDKHVLVAQVSGVPDARNVAERVADSVIARAAGIRGELHFGPLPAGLHELSTIVQGTSPGDATTEQRAADPARPSIPALRAEIVANPPGVGEAVAVRGTSGSYLAGEGTVVVRLPSGRWLAVSGQLPKDVLVAVADGIVLDAAPDYRWVGSS